MDLEKQQILVCEAYKRSINEIEPYPKQKDWAIVPVPIVLANYLEFWKKSSFPKSFVASGKQGGMLEYRKFHRNLWKLCEQANVPKVSPHELRHSCTEIWFRSGASLEDVRRLLNHKSAETTRRYIHRSDDRLLKIAGAIQKPI